VPKRIAHVDDEDFPKEVLESKLPVVVDFSAPWCGPCRVLEPIFAELAEEFKGKVKFVKVNTDENSECTAKYGIRSIPTVIGFRREMQSLLRSVSVPKQICAHKLKSSSHNHKAPQQGAFFICLDM